MPLQDHVPGTADAEGRRRLNASLGGLLLGNLTLLASFAFGWITLGELLWTYWFQSVVIGAFNVLRIRALQRFTTDGMTMNDRPVPTTPEAKRQVANFFTIHYGFFHLIYAIFLFAEHPPAGWGWLWLVGVSVMFGASELSTFRRHRAADRGWEPNLGTLMFQPYLRIVPMHLTIVGAASAGFVFLPLKTLADVGMYLVDEHMDAKRARAQSAGARAAGA
jgi:hypothetical protein